MNQVLEKKKIMRYLDVVLQNLWHLQYLTISSQLSLLKSPTAILVT
jgi:hypothetical protein